MLLPPLITIFMCIKLSNECIRCLGAAALAGSGAGRRRARLRRAGPRTANRAFRGACGSAVGGLSRPEVGLDAAPSGRARRPAPPDGGGYPPRPLPRSGGAAEPPIRNSQHMVRWTVPTKNIRDHMDLTTGFAAITVLPADTVGRGHP